MTQATLNIKVDSSEVDKGKKSLDSLAQSGADAEKGVNKTTTAAAGLTSAAKTAATALSALGLSLSIREVIQFADEWNNASNRLRLVTNSASELASVQQSLMGTANETRAAFSGTAELFTVLTRSTKDLGLSQAEIISLTKTLNQSFAVSGASAGAMDGAIRQLSQGLQSGALRGDEFNSVAEQAPGILDAVAASLQMGRGELRDFAAQGGITSQVLVKAIQDYSDVIAGDFSKAQQTFGQSMMIAKNNMLEFVGGANAVQSAVGTAGRGVVLLTDNLDLLADAAAVLSGIVGTRLVVSFGAQAAAMAATTTATGVLTASTTALRGAYALIGGPIGAVTLALGGLALAYMQVSDAQDRAAKGAQDWILKQDAQTLDLQMYALATQIKNANTQLEALERNSSSGSRRIREQKEEIARLASEMEIYARKRAELTNAENKGTVTTERLKTEVGKLGAELGVGAKKIDYTTESLLDMSAVMESLRTGHVPGLDRTMQELNDRIEQSKFRMIGVTDASREMANVSHETAEQRIREEEQVAEAAQRQWENTRDYLAETFIDIADNGGSAFEKIGEAAIAVIKRIIAEWLAAKALMALGINAPFSASAGGIGGGILGGIGSSIGKSVLGVGGNSMVAPSTAAGGLINGIGSFMTSPAGIAIASALIAGKIIHDKTSDPDSYTRSSAGFLTAPTAGARSEQTFSVGAFSSGFKPIGFADKTSQEEARKVIDSYRELDAVLVKAANALGGFVDMSKATLSGVGADGIAGTSGTFMGMGGKSTEADIAAMANSYAKQFVKHIEGISPDVVAKLAGASSATELISVMKQIAESNEFIAKQDSTLSAIYAQMPRELQSALSELSGIKEVNGMLFNSNGDLVDSNRKVIASADVLSLVMESLPLDMQNAITKSMMDAERKKAEDAAKLSAGAFSAVFGSSSGGASADVASLRVREHVASLAEIRELEGNLAAMGLSHIAATPAGIDLDSSRSMLSIYNSGDISAANSFAIANPDIAKSVGYKSTPTSEIQTMKEEMQNMVISLQSIVVSSNMTARAITEAVKQGEGSLSVVVA